jgi:hypothetical protein
MTSPDFRALGIADSHETRHELLTRFTSVRACSADNVIEIDVGALSTDARSLFESLLKRGVLVAWRGGYYLDEQALRKADRPTVRLAIIGAIIVLALIGGMAWLIRP